MHYLVLQCFRHTSLFRIVQNGQLKEMEPTHKSRIYPRMHKIFPVFLSRSFQVSLILHTATDAKRHLEPIGVPSRQNGPLSKLFLTRSFQVGVV